MSKFSAKLKKHLKLELNSKRIFAILIILLFQTFMVYILLDSYSEILAISVVLIFIVINYWFFIDVKNDIKKIEPLSEIVSYLPLIIVSAPLFANAILLALFYEPTLQFRKYIVGEVSDWIVFFGSITGGLLTMLAVYFTLKNDNKEREKIKADSDLKWKEEKASLYLPIFEINKQSESVGMLGLVVDPVNNNAMRDFALIDQTFGDNSLIDFLYVLEDISFISGKNERNIELKAQKNRLPSDYKASVFLSTLLFQYSDALRIKRYMHKVEFFVDIYLDENGNICSYIDSSSIKNYPLFESHFYVEGEYPIVFFAEEVNDPI
jgi:hypothetical protein